MIHTTSPYQDPAFLRSVHIVPDLLEDFDPNDNLDSFRGLRNALVFTACFGGAMWLLWSAL